MLGDTKLPSFTSLSNIEPIKIIEVEKNQTEWHHQQRLEIMRNYSIPKEMFN